MRTITQGHVYELDNFDGEDVQTLRFIHKENQDGKLVTVENGTTNEQVIAVLIDRLQFLDTIMPSDFNKVAIQHLDEALLSLQNRTADREQRAVEGTPAE